MRKYTNAEQVEVLPPEDHEAAEEALHAMGKTSARDLTDEEREQFLSELDTPSQ